MSRRSHSFRRAVFLICLTIFLGCIAELSVARSIDLQDCPLKQTRLEYGDIVFCWPTGSSAPQFRIESPGILIGSEYWIEGRPASTTEVEASDNSPGSQGARPALAIFRIVPADHALLRTDWHVPASFEVEKALAMRGDQSEVAVSVFMGQKFGTRELRFRETQPRLFEAALVIGEGVDRSEFEFSAPLSDTGTIDYATLCTVQQQIQVCSGQFVLANDIATITMNFVRDADQARYIFEAMRAQIRSYVLFPKL